MKFNLIFPSLTLLVAIGCDGQSTVVNGETLSGSAENSTIDETIMATFSGATFVLVSDTPADTATISFTADTVTWLNTNGTEVGTYTGNDNGDLIANISDREIIFSGDGINLDWDSQTYQRAAQAQFDSPESLVSYLDGSTYLTVEQFDIGENAFGGLAMGNWSVRFADNEVTWRVQDTVSAGAVSFIDGSSFRASFFGQELTIVVLHNDQLVVNSVVYEKDFSELFDSQQSLIEYLNNTTYQSADLRPTGETVAGTVAIGHWYIDFVADTFTWAFEDVAVAGSYIFAGENTFTASVLDRDIEVTFDRDDILWDGVKYIRQ